MNDTYYFKELLATLRGASPEFQTALADKAIQQLSNATGTKEHAKAVTVLAYLGDSRLVDHLAARLTENGLLDNYENHALIAVGMDAAGALFARSALAVGERLAPLPNDYANHDARMKLMDPVHFPVYDVRYLITPAFEPHLQRVIEDSNSDVSWIATDLAKRGVVPSLLYTAAVAAANRKSWFDLDQGEQRQCVIADVWLGWWRQSTDDLVRPNLLGLLPLCPNAEIEEVLMDCLDSPNLRRSAARRLGEYGAIHSAVRLREILAEEITADDRWDKSEAAHALGDLRDDAAVPLLEKVAREHSDGWVVKQAVSSLGLIGNSEAERALGRLLQHQKGEDFENMVLEAMLCCGSESAVGEVVNRAKARPDGPKWLCDRLRRLTWTRGWRRGEYFTHIHTAELVEYLESHHEPGSPEQNWSVGDAFRQIDSPAVRALLRKWGSWRGSPKDPLVRENDQRRISDMCYWELRDRGDESAIGYTLDERADQPDDIYVAIAADQLRIFPAAAVAEQLRLRLAAATTKSELLRLLALLGRFGETVDAELASRFQDHPDDLVANVACEARLRLSDPMLVPDRWREM